MSSQEFALIDLSGVERFKGVAVPPIGGGTPKSGCYTGRDVLIADGATAALTWDTFAGNDPVLDLTTPTLPRATIAGLHVVSATVYAHEPLTVDGSYIEILNMLGGSNASGIQYAPAATAALLQPVITVTVAEVFQVGDAMELDITNRDGASARRFAISRANVAVYPAG